MSVECELLTISGKDIELLMSKPELIGDLQRIRFPRAKAQPRTGFLSRLIGQREEVETQTEPRLYRDYEMKRYDLGRAWEPIAFAFAGDPYCEELPLGFLAGGKDVGDEPVGYGPARALTPTQVKKIHTALSEIPRDESNSKLCASALVAGEVMAEDEAEGFDDHVLPQLIDHADNVRSFFERAAQDGMGVLVCI